MHQLFTADQDGMAKALALEGIGGADDRGLFALGKDDALLGRALHSARDLLLEGRRWIEALGQRGAVGVHIFDGLARHARIHSRLGHEGGDIAHQARVEG